MGLGKPLLHLFLVPTDLYLTLARLNLLIHRCSGGIWPYIGLALLANGIRRPAALVIQKQQERRRRRRRKKESYFCRSLWRPARRRVILKTFRIKHRQFWTVRKTCGTIYVDSNVVASCTVSSRSLINYPAPLNNFSVGCDASDVGKQTASNWETSV